jgi:hypothetical protein
MKYRIGVAIASLTLFATACGGSDSASGNLGATVLAAATNTTEAETSKATMTVTMDGVTADQTEPLTVTMDGALNHETAQGEFLVNTPGIAGNPLSSTRMIMDGTDIYMQLPPDAATGFGGKSWLKIDAAAEAGSSGIDINALSTQSGNPSENLEMLLGISDDVTKIGEEKIRDEKTTHYRGTLDFTKAADEEKDDAKKNALLELNKLYGNQPVPVDVWLDAKDRVRKMEIAIDMSKMTMASTSEAPTGTMRMSMEFYDFGADVNLQLPATDQVITQAELEQLAATEPAAA